MKLSKKQSFNKSSSHRRLWLSSIVTLFILATSISAYFLVKNSQDIRKSASDPYPGNCTCIYNSACSVVGMQPCTACSPACSPPAICCQPITSDLCTQGERYCVDANRIATCKPDRSGYTIRNCANGTSCNSQQNLCIADPTPNPAATCQQNGGECIYNSSCSVVNRSSLAGTCPPPAVCCGASLVNNCTQGNSYCVDANRVAICKLDRSGYTISNCATGTQCDSTLKACKSVAPLTPTCQGTCYTNTSCSAIGKVPASGTCRYDTSICCKEATTTTPTCQGTCYTNESCTAIGKVPAGGTCLNSTSICCKEADSSTPVVTTGTNCEGSCYDASSCDAIGKRQASGSCAASVLQIFNGLVCCKENVLAAPGSLRNYEFCVEDSECESGNCSNWVRYEASGPGVYYPDRQCLASQEDQQIMVDASNKVNTAALVTASVLVGGYLLAPAIPSIIGLTGGNPFLLPAAAYSYTTAAISTAPAWAQTALQVGTVATGWVGILSGQKACADDPNSNACAAFVAGVMIAPSEIMELEDMTKNLVNKAGNSVNNYLTQQINQTFDGMDSWGYGYQAVDSEVTDYLFPDKTNILGDQLYGNVYSPAVEKTSSVAQLYIAQGEDPYKAIAQATNDIMPPYWHQTNAEGVPVNVPAGNVSSLEELVSCEGAVCKQFTQLSTPVANNMGYDADFVHFRMSIDTSTGSVESAHAVTLVKNLDGTFGVIDATNPKLTRNNIVDYINNIESHGWHPITDFSGAMKGYTFQIIH